MNEQTIIVHDGHKRNPTVLNRAQYDALCASGMMWEFHPDAPLKWPYPDKTTAPTPDQPTATETPRTDAKCKDYFTKSAIGTMMQFIPADFARTLEHELTEAKAEVQTQNNYKHTAIARAEKAEAELTALRTRVAELEQDKARLTKLFLLAADLAERYFDPGPIPASEPTDADTDMGHVIYEAQKLRAAIDAAQSSTKNRNK